MERRSDIEEGDSSGLNRADPNILHIKIDEKIRRLPRLLPEACIFRVHDGMRRANADAYTPMLVSIGPYHHGNPKLRAMEEHKLRYLQSFLKRSEELSAERYLQRMVQLEQSARQFYAEPRYGPTGDNYAEMMLLDACFIIEFLWKHGSVEELDKDDTIFKSPWMWIQILSDMMLLENQLPFFVLSELNDMAFGFSPTELLDLFMIPIMQTLQAPPSLEAYMRAAMEHKSLSEIKHFLDLLHNVCRPKASSNETTESNQSRTRAAVEHKCLSEIEHFLDLLHNVCRPKASSNETTESNHKSRTQVPCLTELYEAGVSFKVSDESRLGSCFDIKFEQGHLEIPNFRVDYLTETLFRNLIAYEQHSLHVKPMCFTDYTYFMDKLINTGKDVTTLRLSGIMENWLGDDEQVARMFNNMGDGRNINTATYYYSDLCEKLNKHCATSCNQAMAKLRRNYFNNPWATISTIAAVFLIFLTLTQTVASLITLFA